MRRLLSLVLVSAAVAALAPVEAPAVPPAAAEAVFVDARSADDLLGVLTSADAELAATIWLPAGSRLSADLAPDATVTGAAAGVSLVLRDPDDTEVPVTGTSADRSKEGRDAVAWRGVEIGSFGLYTLAVHATTPGGVRLRISATDAKTKLDVSSETDLAPDDAAVPLAIAGRTGDVLKFDLRPGTKSKFRGTLTRLRRPDGSDVAELPEGAQGKLVLDSDGVHTLEFANTGSAAGSWRAVLSVKPRKATKRRGLVSAAQTGLVPKVGKLDPSKAVHLDTALLLTISGRDFQPGMDVRLERKGRDPIVASDVHVTSDTLATCVLDLDTRDRDGGTNSVGTWNVAVRNAPVFADPEDPSTIDTSSPLVDARKPLQVVSSGSITLPKGVQPETEVWQLVFNADFQRDLDLMGLGSDDVELRNAVRDLVEDYVHAYVRSLFGVNETNGKVKSGSAVPVSFVRTDVTRVAGLPGEDYNRIEIGGEAEDGDPSAPGEALPWGFAPFDSGNGVRDDLLAEAADGSRLGYGARTRVLDPRGSNADVSASFRQAMQPLRDTPLTVFDRGYVTGRFDPGNAVQAARFGVIASQVERASREIAAIVAHHVGRAMGLPTGGDGPMAAPTLAGDLWPGRADLAFGEAALAVLRSGAVPHALPGKSGDLKLIFLPIIDLQPELLPNLTTGQPYTVLWQYVGGRPNALPSDYTVKYYTAGTPPVGLTVGYQSLTGTAPICLDNGACGSIGAVYCRLIKFGVLIDDTVRGGGSVMVHRLKILPDLNAFPAGHPLRPAVQSCYNQVLGAP